MIMSGKKALFYGLASIGDEPMSINGVDLKSYSVWRGMLKRCYCDSYKETFPTYEGCSVCDEWLDYKNFKAWHGKNYVDEYHLDKDITKRNNKTYSPSTCAYVPLEINAIVLSNKKLRGKYPQGVNKNYIISRINSQKETIVLKQKELTQRIGL